MLDTPALATAPVRRGARNQKSWEIHTGDAATVLSRLPSSSVDCVVTSPPYYWLRDYGMDGQTGHEDTVAEYVATLVRAFSEIFRVLKPTGTVFLVIGDTYYSGKGRSGGLDPKQSGRRMEKLRAVERAGFGLPRKSLIGVPWRVALGLQAAGWTLRSSIIWRKSERISEPRIFDRPWATTENIFLLSKGQQYHFDRSALGGEEDVWTIPVNNALRRYRHAAPFPVELAGRCIATGCPVGGIVLDPYCGSGTTLMAAAAAGYHSIGVELNPEYAAMAATRLGSGTDKAVRSDCVDHIA